MKILIANAIWGRNYCTIFTRFSLATLLSPGNIPRLAERASITFHIFTTNSDRKGLRRDPAVAELARHCAIEWEIIEDYTHQRPPVGPGGEKYTFLSALQNIAIKRALDHDAIVFNYADFIWTDGTVTTAAERLFEGETPCNAVLGFCLPVDRDAALPAMSCHRDARETGIIKLSGREGAKIAVDCMHREARIRSWEGRYFTNLPTYLIWPVDGQGILIRAYHQSILAMRVRPDDPEYLRGITRGSLDACLTAQLAESGMINIATDTDKMLVFSLYDTPVDSRIPPDETREMSLRNMLASVATPGQRRFAEQPIYMRTADGDEGAWSAAAESSLALLRNAHDTIAFDQGAYDENYKTHGLIPKLRRRSRLSRFIPKKVYDRTGPFLKRGRRIAYVLVQPSLLQAALARRSARIPRFFKRARRIAYVLGRPSLLRRVYWRRMAQLPVWWARDSRLVALLIAGDADAVEAASIRWPWSYPVAPNIKIATIDKARLMAATIVEHMSARITNHAELLSALHTAERLLRRAIRSAPIWPAPVRALGRNLWFQSRFAEAIETMAQAETLHAQRAEAAGWPADLCLFLPNNCVESIGLMGHLDAFVKYKKLTDDSRHYYLLARPQNTVNPVFLDYWKPHLTVISHPEEIDRLAPMEEVYGVNWNWVMPKRGGGNIFLHSAMADVQREWESTGGKPLLELRQDHAQNLGRSLARWGVAPGERFVCLHVRSVGFYGATREAAQQFRNTPLDSYYPLIRALGEMGYWVIRMGDTSMPPLDLKQCGGSGRVYDYALSPERSAELDVALCAKCELFISSPSGLHTVAHAFGRPVCEVNYPIYEGFPWHTGDIFIPQLYFSQEKKRVLTLEEILGTDIIHCDHQFLLERAGISLIPNEPDEIVEVVREALSPSSYSLEDEAGISDRVLGTFDRLNRQYERGISGRLGRYFAMKYASCLSPQATDTDVTLTRCAS